jgi:hypothetical protein
MLFQRNFLNHLKIIGSNSIKEAKKNEKNLFFFYIKVDYLDHLHANVTRFNQIMEKHGRERVEKNHVCVQIFFLLNSISILITYCISSIFPFEKIE